jgi:hypothetical protein
MLPMLAKEDSLSVMPVLSCVFLCFLVLCCLVSTVEKPTANSSMGLLSLVCTSKSRATTNSLKSLELNHKMFKGTL